MLPMLRVEQSCKTVRWMTRVDKSKTHQNRNTVDLARFGFTLTARGNLGLQVVSNVADIDSGAIRNGDPVNLASFVRLFPARSNVSLGTVEDVPDVDGRAVSNGNTVNSTAIVGSFTTRQDLYNSIVGNIADVESRAVLYECEMEGEKR